MIIACPGTRCALYPQFVPVLRSFCAIPVELDPKRRMRYLDRRKVAMQIAAGAVA
jgi:hypothetical protein